MAQRLPKSVQFAECMVGQYTVCKVRRVHCEECTLCSLKCVVYSVQQDIDAPLHTSSVPILSLVEAQGGASSSSSNQASNLRTRRCWCSFYPIIHG